MLTVLIMAGGSGERFWPLSTPKWPKQLLSIFTGKPMIRETVDRIIPLVPIERIFVATNMVQVPAIREVLPDLPESNFIIEPTFKDTAAAIGYGCLNIEQKYQDAIVAVLASDHLIKDNKAFLLNVEQAYHLAQQNDCIVTLGIKPTRPETGYGYIEVSDPTINTPTKVIKFKEKPNYDLALEYIESGNFLWNSGMFVFSIETIKNAFKCFAPDHAKILNELENNLSTDGEIQKSLFEKFDKISIDYAIMEKYPNILLIPTNFGWNDVGDYNALAEIMESDQFGNIDLTRRSVFVDSNRNIVISENDDISTICFLGVSDHIVVLTNNKLLIVKRSDTQKIKLMKQKVDG